MTGVTERTLDLNQTDLNETDLGATDLGATDLGATDLGATDLGATDLGATDLDRMLGPQVECQESQLHDELVGLIDGSRVQYHLQSMYEAATGVVIGAEVLARLPGPFRPSEWFQIAHSIGLGHDLELRLVHDIVERAAADPTTMLAVNISPQVIADPRLIRALDSLGHGRLMIEITDQTPMPELSKLRRSLAEIRSRGIRVALHVGELGPDALRTLLIYQPDVVKLRVNVTTALASGALDPRQSRHFFACCRQSGIFVIAVGVESEESLDSLVRLGVSGYQGFITRSPGFAPSPRW